jgi:hypothetical protein
VYQKCQTFLRVLPHPLEKWNLQRYGVPLNGASEQQYNHFYSLLCRVTTWCSLADAVLSSVNGIPAGYLGFPERHWCMTFQ